MKRLKYKECLLVVCTYNNGLDLKSTFIKKKKNFPIDILVYVDGSTDGSEKFLFDKKYKNIKVLVKKKRFGIASMSQNFINYAKKNNYKYICTFPGNNKNNINCTIRFFDKLISNKAEYVQGSRFLKNGGYDNTPLTRIILIKLFSFILTLFFKKKCTDCSEGVRAYKISILDHPQINIKQKWIKNYEHEGYLHFKVLKLNFKYCELSVKKIYPKNKYNVLFNRSGKKYSYIKPIIDWFNILKPYFYLSLRIKN